MGRATAICGPNKRGIPRMACRAPLIYCSRDSGQSERTCIDQHKQRACFLYRNGFRRGWGRNIFSKWFGKTDDSPTVDDGEGARAGIINNKTSQKPWLARVLPRGFGRSKTSAALVENLWK